METVLRFVVIFSAVLTIGFLPGCSDDDNETTDTNPFKFLAGNWGVVITPQGTNCQAEVYFPQEAWVVTTNLASVSAMTIPDTSTGPMMLTPGAEPVAYELDTESSQGQTIPPSYSAVMGETLFWSASGEENSMTETGCLSRNTTLLNVQFTPEGQLIGTRSVFRENIGGDDCPEDCRTIFDLQGAMVEAK